MAILIEGEFVAVSLVGLHGNAVVSREGGEWCLTSIYNRSITIDHLSEPKRKARSR